MAPSDTVRRQGTRLWTERAREAVGALFLATSFLVLGCLLIENDVNYPAWSTLSPLALVGHHQAVQHGLSRTMFPLMGLHLVAGIVSALSPSARMTRGSILLVLVLFLTVLVESFAVQVPLHEAVASTGSQGAVEELLRTHRLFRLPLEALYAAASFAMLLQLFRPPSYACAQIAGAAGRRHAAPSSHHTSEE